MRTWRALVAALPVISILSSDARADPVTFRFTVELGEAESYYVPTSEIFGVPIFPGQVLSGRFTYDPSRPSEPFLSEDDRTVRFAGEPYGMSVTVGAATGRVNTVGMRIAREFLSVSSFGPLRS